MYLIKLLTFFTFLVLISCSLAPKKNSELNLIHTEVVVNDTLFFRNDTIVIARPIAERTGVILKWGVTSRTLHTSKDTLPYSLFGFGKTYKKGNFFVVEDGCGTGCKYLYVASFLLEMKGELFLSPLLVDLEKGLIIYQGESVKELVTVKNVISGKTLKVKEKFDRTKRPLSLAIDTIFVENANLVLTWYSPIQKKITKKFSLESLL